MDKYSNGIYFGFLFLRLNCSVLGGFYTLAVERFLSMTIWLPAAVIIFLSSTMGGGGGEASAKEYIVEGRT